MVKDQLQGGPASEQLVFPKVFGLALLASLGVSPSRGK
jgi:hypothetical protein